MNVIFMGTPEFAVPTLKALHESQHTVVAVYCQPPRPAGRGHQEQISPVQNYAMANNLPVYHPESLGGINEQEEFAAHQADIAVVAAYGLLLPPAILTACPQGCINVHPSDLPRWRGAAPLNRTIMAGDTRSAMCIMQMDEGLDTGDILLRRTFDIPAQWDAGNLHDHSAQLGAKMILEALEHLHTITPQPQPDEGVTYASKITREETRIDWQQSAEKVLNHIRGLNPYPAAFTQLGSEVIKVMGAELAEGSGTAGTTLDDALTVACGTGAIRLLELQRTGRKRMSAEELLRGFSIPQGSKLG